MLLLRGVMGDSAVCFISHGVWCGRWLQCGWLQSVGELPSYQLRPRCHRAAATLLSGVGEHGTGAGGIWGFCPPQSASKGHALSVMFLSFPTSVWSMPLPHSSSHHLSGPTVCYSSLLPDIFEQPNMWLPEALAVQSYSRSLWWLILLVTWVG